MLVAGSLLGRQDGRKTKIETWQHLEPFLIASKDPPVNLGSRLAGDREGRGGTVLRFPLPRKILLVTENLYDKEDTCRVMVDYGYTLCGGLQKVSIQFVPSNLLEWIEPSFVRDCNIC